MSCSIKDFCQASDEALRFRLTVFESAAVQHAKSVPSVSQVRQVEQIGIMKSTQLFSLFFGHYQILGIDFRVSNLSCDMKSSGS